VLKLNDSPELAINIEGHTIFEIISCCHDSSSPAL